MTHSTTSALDITSSEWFIMRTVWAQPSCTSRDIIDTVLNVKPWKEGTIKSLISRLEKKALLIKDTTQRPYTFTAAIPEQVAIDITFDHLVDRMCHKKHQATLSHLIDTMELSKEDTLQLIKQLEQKSIQAPEEVICTCPKGQCTCHLK